jgi:hypothetical protein
MCHKVINHPSFLTHGDFHRIIKIVIFNHYGNELFVWIDNGFSDMM